MQRCVKVSCCPCQFVIVVAHHSPLSWAHGRNGDNYGSGKFSVHYPEALSGAAHSKNGAPQVSAGLLVVWTGSEIVDSYLLLNLGIRA